MELETMLSSIFAVATAMVVIWWSVRSGRLRLWTHTGLSLAIGWVATIFLAADNIELANDMAKVAFCAIGLTVLFELIGTPGRAKVRKKGDLPDASEE